MNRNSPSLDIIAKRIDAHLSRFAKSEGNKERPKFWHPCAYRGGARCMIRYVAYQFTSSLTKSEAERYMAGLDAGNIGTHYFATAGLPDNPGDASNTDESKSSVGQDGTEREGR